MELRQLETFCAVVRTRGFGSAARELYMTQPAVSLQIRALEEELKVRLFERTGRSIRLTHSGELFHTYALRIVQLAREAKQAIADTASGDKGRVVVGAGATTTIFTLPPVLQALRSNHPGIDVIIRTGTSGEVARMVKEGEVDVGLVTSPVQEEDLVLEPLLEDRIVAIVARDHPLAADSETTLARLAQEPLILFVRGTGFRSFLDSIFAAAGITPQVHMELDSIEAIKVLVETGLGASFVPEVAVREEIAEGRLAALAIEDVPRMSRSLAIIYRRDKYIAPAIRIFLDTINGQLRVSGGPSPDEGQELTSKE